MPKFLFKASYTSDGLKLLRKDKASGRKTAVHAAVEGLGGKLEAMYYTFGDDDVIAIVELPTTRARPHSLSPPPRPAFRTPRPRPC